MGTIKVCLTIFIIVLYLSSTKCQSFKAGPLEQYRSLYKLTRSTMMAMLGRNSEDPYNMRLAKQMNMLQDVVPPSIPFPCNVTGFRSAKPPLSVHQVRPGDIDIVGALGDSLTAGFGLVATRQVQVLMENRGLSWSIGGQGTWRQYITLPNILKEFNPNLIGYSLTDSYTDDRNSQFNPAEGGAISSEIPYMAKILLQRIKMDKRVNLKKDWKLITIMVGANDFCLDICFHNNMTEFLESHRRDMIEVLRFLRDNLPRTIINYVPPPHVRKVVELSKRPEDCRLINQIECYCLFSNRFKNNLETYYELMEKWQEIDKEITKMPEFHQNDFTVIFQPFVIGIEVPQISKDQTDWSFLSKDCFHLSQKMNARAANALWNNMLERVGNKSHDVYPLFDRFLCPTKENQYIFTSENS